MNLPIDRLVEDEIFEEAHFENKVDVDSDNAVKLKQLEIQMEIELAKLQEQERKKNYNWKKKNDLEKTLKQHKLD